jgi:hypothetical protein
MAVEAGYSKIATSGSVFIYDTGDTINSYLGKPTTNFYTNGQFANGQGIPQEGGSNPTNTVIYFPNNPGNSDYVLQQNGNYTEYQINLTTQLVSNTTYVMSGWYAQSSDYNGQQTMFHARAFSASGNNVATGTGLGTVLATRVIGGITWSYCYQTITTPSDYSADFNWYLGYGSPTSNGYRYYTNIQMEQGTFPSQFVNGTRSNTGALLDLSGIGSSINVANVSFTQTAFPSMTFDGTDDVIDISTNFGTLSQYTFEHVSYKGTDSRMPIAYRTNTSFYQYGDNSWAYTHGGVWGEFYYNGSNYNGQGPINGWGHWVITYDGTKVSVYRRGQLTGTQNTTGTADWSGGFKIGYWAGGGAYAWNGQIAVVKMYNRALSASEVLSNYNHYKTRFNIT